MDFIFGFAIGITVGFLIYHVVNIWDKPMVGEARLDDYTAQEGAYNDDSD